MIDIEMDKHVSSMKEVDFSGMKYLEDMLYSGAFMPEHEILFEKIEAALGFKLFFWQKTFIIYGTFRRFGKTTAECIRDLVRTDLPPIDFTRYPRTPMEDFYRKEMVEIQKKLSAAGIKTRTIRWPAWKREVERRIEELDGIKIKCEGCKYKIPGGDYHCNHCCRKERVDFYEPIV